MHTENAHDLGTSSNYPKSRHHLPPDDDHVEAVPGMKLDREARIAEMSMAEFEGLLEYSSSIPTGQTKGKVWKRHMANGDWWLGEYGETEGTNILIHWYHIGITVGSKT